MALQLGVAGVITGNYRVAVTTGLTTGLSANDPIFSFRWGNTLQRAVIQSLRIGAQVITPFTAANEVNVNAIVARGFSVSDTGGTQIVLTTTNARLTPQSIPSLVTDARVATTGTLAAGTRTLDAQAILSVTGDQALAAAAAALSPIVAEYKHNPDNYGLQLDTNEGIIVRSGVALGAGGTVRYTVEIEWSEFSILSA